MSVLLCSSGEDVMKLLGQAEKALGLIPPQTQLARNLCENAYRLEPNHVLVQTRYADVLCQLGELDTATTLFKLSLAQTTPTPSPSSRHTATTRLSGMSVCRNLMQLGQLTCGWEALGCFCSAVQRLSNRLQTNYSKGKEEGMADQLVVVGDPWATRAELSNMMCGAYCSMAEIYMTDLCDEDDAESRCLENIEQALLTCPNNFEAHCTMSQYRKIVGDVEEAISAAKRAIEILRKAATDADEDDCLPSLEIRVNLSRTLIDLSETSDAVELLEGCLREDEEDLQVWYVLGCALLVSGDFDGALEAAEKAKHCLESSSLSSDPTCTMSAAVYELVLQANQEHQKRQIKTDMSTEVDGTTDDVVRREG
eukprot:GHVS01095405.1.p1 GENE.GHVS01095405.1~~GHVS01095405.1.p1  ORF type:complete len:367 (-),score=83.92 GHVS01095405.1:305-1405(-)